MEVEGLLRLLKEHKVRFVIEMKEAAGRPKDKEDLKFLRRLRQKRARRPDRS
jgi:hypothetical protein